MSVYALNKIILSYPVILLTKMIKFITLYNYLIGILKEM